MREKNRRKYEKPVLIPFGLSPVASQQQPCNPFGSAPSGSNCQDGIFAWSGKCQDGWAALGSQCNPGTAAAGHCMAGGWPGGKCDTGGRPN